VTARRRLSLVLQVATPVGVVLLLQWWTARRGSLYFPTPVDVWDEFQATWLFERAGTDLLGSLVRMFAGLLLGCTAGYVVGLGLALGPRLLQWAVDPVIEFVRAIPPPAFLPFVLVVFGVDDTGKVLLIALGTTFPVLLNTVAGVREIDPLLYDVCASYDVRTRRAVVGRVVIPASMPRAFAGLQTSLAVALILMVISEMVASRNGLGRFILESQRTFAITPMWSGIVMLGILGFTLNAGLRRVEHHVLRWHRGVHGSAAA
jgi:ABC-type nitrate/sulfonate/bicarbonate transport system permease component